jgi:NADPH-dependent 7-cyano-7-deazaguanine reductase QueF
MPLDSAKHYISFFRQNEMFQENCSQILTKITIKLYHIAHVQLQVKNCLM